MNEPEYQLLAHLNAAAANTIANAELLNKRAIALKKGELINSTYAYFFFTASVEGIMRVILKHCNAHAK